MERGIYTAARPGGPIAPQTQPGLEQYVLLNPLCARNTLGLIDAVPRPRRWAFRWAMYIGECRLQIAPPLIVRKSYFARGSLLVICPKPRTCSFFQILVSAVQFLAKPRVLVLIMHKRAIRLNTSMFGDCWRFSSRGIHNCVHLPRTQQGDDS